MAEKPTLAEVLLDRGGSGATGGWGDEPQRSLPSDILDYIKALPGRAMVGFGAEGNRLLNLGRAGPKEQARDMFGIGRFVDAYDAAQEGQYLPAAGNVALGAADLAGPARSKAPAAVDAALQAWQVATQARPAQVAEELAKLTTKRMKPTGTAADRRAAAAERAIPWPEVPVASGSPQRARSMLDVVERTWPGNVGAGGLAVGGASGIPGVVLDDLKSLADPLYDLRKEAASEPGRIDRKAPFREDAGPEIGHYQKQRSEAARARNLNIGLAGAESVGGVGTTYGAIKSTPWAASKFSPGMAGLALDLGMIHPALLPLGLAAAAAPFAVPVGLGAASWGLSHAIPGNIEHAHKAHEKAKLLDKILDNYRAQPNPMTVGPGDY